MEIRVRWLCPDNVEIIIAAVRSYRPIEVYILLADFCWKAFLLF